MSNSSIYPLTLFYDASCPLCRLEIENLMARDTRHMLSFIDASAQDFDAGHWGIEPSALMRIIHAVRSDARHC